MYIYIYAHIVPCQEREGKRAVGAGCGGGVYVWVEKEKNKQ